MEILNQEEGYQQIKERLKLLESQQAINRSWIRYALQAGLVSDIQELSIAIREMRRKPGGLRELNERIRRIYCS